MEYFPPNRIDSIFIVLQSPFCLSPQCCLTICNLQYREEQVAYKLEDCGGCEELKEVVVVQLGGSSGQTCVVAPWTDDTARPSIVRNSQDAQVDEVQSSVTHVTSPTR